MKHLALLFFPILLLAACRPQPPQFKEELAQAQARIQELEAELVQPQPRPNGQLVHIVFLNLKDELSEEETKGLIAELRKLGTIEGVHHLEMGQTADTGDERLLAGQDMAFQMRFENMADYEQYQNHPTHIAVKEALRAYLGGPPAVYDYWRE